MKNSQVLSLVSGVFFMVVFVNAIDISSCTALNTPNSDYNLVNDLNSTTTCLTVNASNLTVDGSGHNINIESSGVAVRVNSAYGNTTIRNLRINGSSTSNAIIVYGTDVTLANITIDISGLGATTMQIYGARARISNSSIRLGGGSNKDGLQFGASSVDGIVENNQVIVSRQGARALTFWPGDPYYKALNITVRNNYFESNRSTAVTVYGNGWGGYFFNNTFVSNNSDAVSTIALYPSTFVNNTLLGKTRGVTVWAYVPNNSINFYGGSITGVTYDYWIRGLNVPTDKTYFYGTNFTGVRRIYFNDVNASFNFDNSTDGSVMVRTNVSVAATTLNRTLISWSNISVKWNETSDKTINVNYNLSGLIPSRKYYVSNDTTTRAMVSDSSGNLVFSVGLNASLSSIIHVNTSAFINEIDVSSCTSLDTPNSVYNLLNDVASTDSVCFTVNASNVVFNGNGFGLNTTQIGIRVSNGYSNITIHDVSINLNTTSGSAINIYASSVAVTNVSLRVEGTVGRGILVSTGSDNSTISNSTINVTTLGSNSAGIYLGSSLSSPTNVKISNNLVIAYNFGAAALKMDGSSNAVINNNYFEANLGFGVQHYTNFRSGTYYLNNTIITKAVNAISVAQSSNELYVNNTIIGALSVQSVSPPTNISFFGGSISSYKLRGVSSPLSVYFYGTNFTDTRQIYFQDLNASFNYDNSTDKQIMVQSNVSVAGTSFNRTLISWSNVSVSWNETSDQTTGVTYNISGLTPSMNYSASNDTTTQVITTDSFGNLAFSVGLSAAISSIIQVNTSAG